MYIFYVEFVKIIDWKLSLPVFYGVWIDNELGIFDNTYSISRP